VLSKRAFERDAQSMGISIKSYRADNVPFGSQEFMADLTNHNQTISFSGTGAHHQNGVAERAIGTITRWARTMLLHSVLHWPDKIDLALWPFAVDYAVYLWNNLPQKDSLYAPIELFSGSKFPSYEL
jgi:transposase InsO family protein